MADQKVTSKTAPTGWMASRYVNGTSFLGLEHTLYMLLVTISPGLVLGALCVAMWLWTDKSATLSATSYLWATPNLAPEMAFCMAATLLVLVPAMLVLFRRTSGEMAKRPGFTGRLAYKLPVYTSLAVLAIKAVYLKILLLSTILYSIAAIGTSVDIGQLYMTQFVPALVALAVVVFVGNYVLQMAKGRDQGNAFNLVALVTAAVLVVALLIAGTNSLRNPKANDFRGTPSDFQSLDRYFDY